ncbi:MAG: hypothetical protein ACM3Q2_17490, partial [Syntrophothermus sp.]
MKVKYILTILLLGILIFAEKAEAQSASNLDVFYQLADSSAAAVLAKLPDNAAGICFKTTIPENLKIFEYRLISRLKESGKTIITQQDTAAPCISIGIENARVFYPEIFRDGLFGGYLVKRNIVLTGNYIINQKNSISGAGSFNFSRTDTISQSEIKELENPALSFTRGDLPGEP